MQLQDLTAQSAVAISAKLDNGFLLPGYFCRDRDLRIKNVFPYKISVIMLLNYLRVRIP